MIEINKERCKGCGLCVDTCPQKIIRINRESHNAKGYFAAECFDNEKCISCKMCAIMCPDCAIKVMKRGKDDE